MESQRWSCKHDDPFKFKFRTTFSEQGQDRTTNRICHQCFGHHNDGDPVASPLHVFEHVESFRPKGSLDEQEPISMPHSPMKLAYGEGAGWRWSANCAGLGELLTSLPGPPSSPCRAYFSEADFRSVDIAYELWYTRSASDFISEFSGANAPLVRFPPCKGGSCCRCVTMLVKVAFH